MHVLIIILIVVAAIIGLPLIAAFFVRKDHYVKREITIKRAGKKVFDYVRLLSNQDKFNVGATADADRKKEFKGTDETAGYIMRGAAIRTRVKAKRK